MAQAETTKDVEESRQISKSIFLTTLQDIRKFLSSTLLDPKIKITEIEENIIQTSITLFLQKESNWYYMHLENLFDINLLHIFCKKIRKNLPTPVSLDNSAPSLYSLLCELSLILYKYEMLNQNTKNDISPVIINYIPDSSHNTSSYNGYYTEWLNIPIEISTRSSCKAVNKIKNTEKKITSLSTHITEQDAKIRTEFEQRRQELIQEFTTQHHEFKQIIAASFNGLSDSYEAFAKEKKKEKDKLFTLCLCTGGLTVIALLFGIFSGNIFDVISWMISQTSKKVNFTATTHIHTIWAFIFLDVILIYFFRIALNNYYAARDELLQIQMRKALCQFAPQFKAFARTTTNSSKNSDECPATVSDGSLDEFARHIFSPLNSRMTPTPHPLDFINQLTSTTKKIAAKRT